MVSKSVHDQAFETVIECIKLFLSQTILQIHRFMRLVRSVLVPIDRRRLCAIAILVGQLKVEIGREESDNHVVFQFRKAHA